MIKKHKELFIYLVFIITFIIFLIINCIKSDAISAGDTISKPVFDSWANQGRAGCFEHVVVGPMNLNVRLTIEITPHADDITIWTTNKGNYSFKTLSSNYQQYFLNLIAGTNTDNGVNTVYRAVKELTDVGLIIQNPSDNNEDKDEAVNWEQSHIYGDGCDTNISNFQVISNNSSGSEIKGLTKDGKHVIIGPFNMSAGISDITVSSRNGGNSTSTTRYYTGNISDAKNTKWENWHTGMPNSGHTFFLAAPVDNDWIGNDGKGYLTVTFKQAGVYVRNAEVFVCKKNSKGQSGGGYTTGNGKTVSFSTEIDVEGVIEKRIKLKLVKQNKLTPPSTLSGAKFVIYYIPSEPVSAYKDAGWLSDSKGDLKTNMKPNVNGAREYQGMDSDGTGITISNLTVGTYYIFETKAPSGYALTCSENYKGTFRPGGNTITPESNKFKEWVKVGRLVVNNNTGDTTIKMPNAKHGAMKIKKVDAHQIKSGNATINENLEDIDPDQTARYKIYADLSKGEGKPGLGNVASGWLKTEPGIGKKYVTVEDAQKYKGGGDIGGLEYGTYYIYEVKAPKGYDLSEQDNYLTNSPSGIPTPNDEEWVYLGKKNITMGIDERGDNGPFIFKYSNGAKNKGLGALEINKKDVKNNKDLEGAKFKIYADLSKEAGGTGRTTSGWVNGNPSTVVSKNYKESINNASEYDSGTTINGLKYGTYYIYETTPPEGCALSEQDTYKKAPADAPANPGDNAEWVYIGKVTITKGEKVETKTITNKQISLGQLEIEKVDSKDKEIKLEGAGFKIYADLSTDASGKGTTENGWLSGDLEDTKEYKEYSDAGIYTTGSDGKVKIDELKYGTYHIFEIQTPKGYNITKQDGYKGIRGGRVSSGTEAESAFAEDEDWVYCGSIIINNWGKEEEPIRLEKPIENKKIIEIEGTVWKDEVLDKVSDVGDSLWNEGNDGTLGGLQVKLYENDVVVAETHTGEKQVERLDEESSESGDGVIIDTVEADYPGFYNFVRKQQGEDLDIYYADLKNMYIEFIYNNKTIYADHFNEESGIEYTAAEKKYVESGKYGYIAVVANKEGGDQLITSKALPEDITEPYLEDELLTGTEDPYPGKAITQKDESYLENYYVDDECKVLGINLGLWEQADPEFDVDETLANVQINMNDYTYTYDFINQEGEEEQLGSVKQNQLPNAPKSPITHKQKQLGRHFTARLYPSDVVANAEPSTNDKLEVRVSYKITITNNQRVHVPETYDEKGLKITSLINYYNEDVYDAPEDDENWRTEEVDESLAREGYKTSKYQPEIDLISDEEGSNKKELYVTYKVKDNVVEGMADDISNEEAIEWFDTKAASQATGTGYHEYLREDHVWDIDGSATGFDGHETDGQFIHKTVEKTYSSLGLFMKFRVMDENRTISGTVFEDEDIPQNEEENPDPEGGNKNLGNGILDEDESKVENVKVELLDLSSLKEKEISEWPDDYANYSELAKLYRVGVAPEDAIRSTGENGTYSFEGVVPGYYLLRFTYGDGTQKIKSTDGDIEVYARDYKSTIITNGIIEKAIEATDADSKQQIKDIYDVYPPEFNNDSDREIVEWYKFITESQYSTVTDSLDLRKLTDEYTYNRDGTITKKEADGTYTKICKFEYDYKPDGQVDKVKQVTLYKKKADGSYEELKLYNDDDNRTRKDLTGDATYEELKKNLLMKSYTPVTSISIENDGDENVEGDTHNPAFSNFNFGIIEEAKTDLKLEKAITNIEFTNQTGSTILNENPHGAKSPYIADLATVNGGSSYVRLELEGNLIYGSALVTTYKIKVSNTENSDIDYIEDDGSGNFGDYFRFGKYDSTTPQKKVKIEELIDFLDQKYEYKSVVPENEKVTLEDGTEIKAIKLDETYTTKSGSETKEDEIIVKIEENKEGQKAISSTTEKHLSMTNWTEIARGESLEVTYTASTLLSKEDDTKYTNQAEVESLSLNKLTTLKNSFEWNKCLQETTLSIYPKTGEDRSNIYWITAVIGLATLVAGIVVIRKKVLKRLEK